MSTPKIEFLQHYANICIKYSAVVKLFKQRIANTISKLLLSTFSTPLFASKQIPDYNDTNDAAFIIVKKRGEFSSGIKTNSILIIFDYLLPKWKFERDVFIQSITIRVFIYTINDFEKKEFHRGRVVKESEDFEFNITADITDKHLYEFINEMWNTIKSYFPIDL
jgi:hypothetical protein